MIKSPAKTAHSPRKRWLWAAKKRRKQPRTQLPDMETLHGPLRYMGAPQTLSTPSAPAHRAPPQRRPVAQPTIPAHPRHTTRAGSSARRLRTPGGSCTRCRAGRARCCANSTLHERARRTALRSRTRARAAAPRCTHRIQALNERPRRLHGLNLRTRWLEVTVQVRC